MATIPRPHTGRCYKWPVHNPEWAHWTQSTRNEPPHNKTNKMTCAQRRLRSAWASAHSDQSSLSTWRNYGFLVTHWVHSRDWSDCADAQVCAERTVILLVSSCGSSNVFLCYGEVRTRRLQGEHKYYTVKINRFWKRDPLEARKSHQIWIY